MSAAALPYGATREAGVPETGGSKCDGVNGTGREWLVKLLGF